MVIISHTIFGCQLYSIEPFSNNLFIMLFLIVFEDKLLGVYLYPSDLKWKILEITILK